MVAATGIVHDAWLNCSVFDRHRQHQPLRELGVDPFTIDALPASAVTVRFWNTVADGGYPIAVFAEAIVQADETVTDVGASALHDPYYEAIRPQVEGSGEPFDTGPISALLVGAVPDAVTDIRTETGENITPVHNIWWDVIDSGSIVTYKVIAGDGRTAELTAG